MPYIFVHCSVNPNGLFSNQTFIDFENVTLENVTLGNGATLGEAFAMFWGSQLVIAKGRASLETISPTHARNKFQTHHVIGRPPHEVLNKLEEYGYKVVAAHSQRPTGDSGVSYSVWTLHKPL